MKKRANGQNGDVMTFPHLLKAQGTKKTSRKFEKYTIFHMGCLLENNQSTSNLPKQKPCTDSSMQNTLICPNQELTATKDESNVSIRHNGSPVRSPLDHFNTLIQT